MKIFRVQFFFRVEFNCSIVPHSYVLAKSGRLRIGFYNICIIGAWGILFCVEVGNAMGFRESMDVDSGFRHLTAVLHGYLVPYDVHGQRSRVRLSV